jgi:hypothetical protein
MNSKIIFFVGLLIDASVLASPPVALLAGISYGFAVVHPLRRAREITNSIVRRSARFGMNLKQVVHAGKSGFLYFPNRRPKETADVMLIAVAPRTASDAPPGAACT